MAEDQITRRILNIDGLPDAFPTHLHKSEFWEELGRTVATFGFLEEVLAKAFFKLSSTRTYSQEEIDTQLQDWIEQTEKSLSETLGALIDRFQATAKQHPELSTSNLSELCDNLREAATLRNMVCHASWRSPDSEGHCEVFYFHKKKGRFDGAISVEYLRQLRTHTVELTAGVINVVTHMGYEFPGAVQSSNSLRRT